MENTSFVEQGFEYLNLQENESERANLHECSIPSKPLHDPYDSDNSLEHEHMERMLTAHSINSSDVNYWETDYVGLKYDSYMSTKEMNGISAKDLFTEGLKFVFPNGIPESYKERYSISSKSSWNKVGSVLFKSFMDDKKNDWLKRHFTTDYSKLTEKNLDCANWKARELWKFWICECNFDNYTEKACHLANCFNKVLMYLHEDYVNSYEKQKEKKTHQQTREDNNQTEKHDKVKGLVNDIVSYLGIPILYNGEGKWDFKHKIKDRIDSLLEFKVKPDLTLCSWTGDTVFGDSNRSRSLEEPFAVIEVFGTSTPDLLEKLKKHSTKSSLMDQSDEQLLEEISLQSLSGDCDKATCKLQKSNEAPEESSSTDQSIDHSQETFINVDKPKNEVCEKIISCGPKSCNTGHVANKLYGQLALQLYGALIQKAKSVSRQVYYHIPGMKEQVIGFLVINEYVYLAKISQLFSYLHTDHIQKTTNNGATITYSKNIFFDLKLSKHRLAFMGFLHHCYRIHEVEKKSRWRRAVTAANYLGYCVNDVVNVSDCEDGEEAESDGEEEAE